MAEGKKKVIVYADWINQFKDLTDEEAGKLIKHFFEYINDLNPVSDRLIELLFNPIKATLKRDLESWLNKQKTNKENGLKGGRPKKTETQNNPNNPVGFLETQNNPQKGVSVNDNVNDIYSFNEFWSDYGKSVDKTKCKAKFEKLSDEIKIKIKEVLPLYVKSTPDKQFRKNPQTWLNGECWNDEVKTIMKEETVEEMNDRMLYENVMKKINMYHAKD
jgi:hypothetical protein